jgi:SAM-dependent methyltransferase
MIEETQIRHHWESSPVGENIAGTLHRDFGGDHEAFFDAYDRWLYKSQGHILRALDQFDWKGKRVLEIGLGQGSDSEQLIRRGALWSGIDLTSESVKRVRRRLAIRNLPFDYLVEGSAVHLPFRERQFDMVYSHGVLHHVPEIKRAQAEIRRVLVPDGRLVVMLYARNSLNYLVCVRLLRRLGLALICLGNLPARGIYGEHKKLAREIGLRNYLRIENFIHRSTDGPHNPYSKVYDRNAIEEDFPAFEIFRTFKLFMHAPPLPVHGLPGESWLGWHLWAELQPAQ